MKFLCRLGRHQWDNWLQKNIGSNHFSQKCIYCSKVRWANWTDLGKFNEIEKLEFDSPDDGSYPKEMRIGG